ncbi:MAG: S41 family peptidase [Candidatus Komeilibacteria bacterium]
MKRLHQSINLSQKILSLIGWSVLVLAIITIGLAVYKNVDFKSDEVINTSNENKYVDFLSEIYEKIQENYWEVITDEDLFNLYKQAAEKLEKKTEVTINNDKVGMRSMMKQIIDNIETEEDKKDFTINVATIVLYNLQPIGRSGLYTTQKETELWNNVKNIDPDTNLYDELEVTEDASREDIQAAAEEKTTALNNIITDNTKTDEERQAAQAKLATITRAEETLTQDSSRDMYNNSGVEATVYGEILSNNILHMKIKKMSPTSFTELQQVANEYDKYNLLDTLILDLRGNIGGAVDLMPYFLGPFIGPNQYAYETYHQGEYEPVKTKVGWLPSLVRYKKVVILQDELGQSSAEVMSAVLKKYNVGVLVGTKSKGWGTIEAVYDIDNQITDEETYKMFLVNSITLRDDNQPIEGRGVDPTIDINDEDWTDQLYSYIPDQTLINSVKKLINQ